MHWGPRFACLSFDGGCFALDGLSIRVGNVRDHVKYRRGGSPWWRGARLLQAGANGVQTWEETTLIIDQTARNRLCLVVRRDATGNA